MAEFVAFKVIRRKILVFVQVLALLAFPQTASMGLADMSVHNKSLIDASDHHHLNEHDDQMIAAHHPEAAHDSTILNVVKRSNSAEMDGIVCHPCCISGVGHCVAILSNLKKVSESRVTRTIYMSRLKALSPHKVAPQPHPPKAYS